MDYSVWQNVRDHSQVAYYPKRRYCRKQGNAANYGLTQGTIGRAVKEFSKRLDDCCS